MCIQEIIKFIKEHIILNTTWIILLFTILYILFNDWMQKSYQISHNTAILLMNKKHATTIDIRNQKDFLAEHVINSINIPIEKIKNNNYLKVKASEMLPLIIINDNGILSNAIIKNFKKIKFKKIYILYGGIIHWKANNLPLVNNK